MSIQNAYLNSLMDRVMARNPAEPEFHQAVREVLASLVPVVEDRPEFIQEGVMDCCAKKPHTCIRMIFGGQTNADSNRGHQLGRRGQGPDQTGEKTVDGGKKSVLRFNLLKRPVRTILSSGISFGGKQA